MLLNLIFVARFQWSKKVRNLESFKFVLWYLTFLVGVNSGSEIVILALFWNKFHERIACNMNEFEP